jgi:hypothetical protein
MTATAEPPKRLQEPISHRSSNLLPVAIVPALTPMATAGRAEVEDDATGELPAETAAPDPRPPVDQAPTGDGTGRASAGEA